MHIGTGQFEGKKLKDSHDGASLSTRILTMKESIFEIIGVRIHEASVLDINDRNGMYGIEAISKGAAVVQFLNKEDHEKELVKENLIAVDLDPKEYILEGNPEQFFIQKTDVHYDIIFFRIIDNECSSMLKRVLELQNENGITVIQHPDTDEYDFNVAPRGFQVIDSRCVEADKCLVMLKKK
jgi:16S rRNA G966 N2-methylase RsmD